MLLRHAFLFPTIPRSHPYLNTCFIGRPIQTWGLFQPENVGNRGSAIELHHALFKFIAFLDAFSRDDPDKSAFPSPPSSFRRALSVFRRGLR